MIINGFKERIKTLRDRNKQIDTELEKDSPESKKVALNDEKEQNNNEIRKQRTEKYEYEQMNEDVCFIKQCCQYLQKIGLTKSQHTFSREFLNKSPHYLSMVICENRKVAPNTLYNLIQNLNQVYDIYLNYDNKQAINRQLLHMIDKGNNLITKRILECYRNYEKWN